MERREIDGVRRMGVGDFVGGVGDEGVRRRGKEVWYVGG